MSPQQPSTLSVSTDDLVEHDLDRQPAESPSAGPTAAMAVGLFVVLVGAFVGFGPIGNNSFLTHLQTGRLIWADGFFTTDPYTFTAPEGSSWVIQSWFASVVYGALHNVGGVLALRIFTGLVAAGLAALLWDASRQGHTILARLAATVPAVFLGIKMWSERPLLLGLLFLASLLVVVARDLSPKILAPIGLFWIWVHGSFPLGIVLLCALALGTRLDGHRPTKELRALGWFVLGVVIGGLLNPFGPRLLWFPINLLRRRDVLGLIREWQPINPSLLTAQLFLVGALVMLVALARSRSFRTAIPGLIFLAAAVMSARNMSVASVVFVPIIAAGFAGTGSLASSARAEWTTKLAVVGAAALACVSIATLATQPNWDEGLFPVAAIDWMEQEGLVTAEESVRFAHTDFSGGYIEFRFDGDVPVYIDDRFEFHSSELVFDYLALARGTDEWEASLDRHGLDIVVWLNQDRLADRINESADWVVQYQDEDWFVACRNEACASN